MKVINDIEFYKPFEILEQSDIDCKIPNIIKGDVIVRNIYDMQELHQYINQYCIEEAIHNHIKENPLNLGEFSIKAKNSNVQFEIRLNKEECIDLCKDVIESVVLDQVIEAFDETNVVDTSDIATTEHKLFTSDRNLEQIDTVLKDYSILYKGTSDINNGIDIDVDVEQDYTIIHNDIEYKSINEVPDEHISNLLTLFSDLMHNTVLDIIIENIEYSVLDVIDKNIKYLQDYDYIGFKGKELEETDFYKWFENSKILISKDEEYWVIDKE